MVGFGGGDRMGVMTLQPPLPLVAAGAVEIGAVAALVEDDQGGRVYVRGELAFVWDVGDEVGRRLAAVQLMRTAAATGVAIAAGFGIERETLRRWMRALEDAGTAGLIPDRRGPKGPSKVTEDVLTRIRVLREQGASLRSIASQVGVSTRTVRRSLTTDSTPAEEPLVRPEVLAEPVPRSAERGLARQGLLTHAPPVFTPAARVPLAGLLLALPGLAATGLLECAHRVYSGLPDGFYGLDTMLLEGVFRALAGRPRAEGAARFAPADLGRVLGMDRAPEVKTIRRKIHQLATEGQAGEVLAGIAAHHLKNADGADTDGVGADDEVGVVLYVDGHVRAYQGGKKIAKTHLSRLRFPAPATVETWVSDAAGDPVLVVMAQPGASLVMELRRLLPQLRAAVGDDRRVLVGFDRGGWSPALFAHMHAVGFDVLTWRKGPTPDIEAENFREEVFVDDTGRQHAWTLADTMVEVPVSKGGETFLMRQITRLDQTKSTAKQVHMLTTRTDLRAGEIVYRMGSRWRQENYFRYARQHLGLDAHDSYEATEDDPDRSVPNPAKRHAHQAVKTAAARVEREKARAEAGLLAAHTPPAGEDSAVVTNQLHNQLTAAWHTAVADLAAAREVHDRIPMRVRLGELAADQQVLDTEVKLIHHAIRIAAFNTTTAIARDIRIHTDYARAEQEAFTLARHVLTQSGDILPDSSTGKLTVRLDSLPTARETTAVAELCEHLSAAGTVYPGTDLILRYEIKPAG